ncbi:MAG: hypothetical protein JEZ03_00920 [Bacteroidales bacterium]|nr:hypothetical protein [Bacteroidales bacterium]
MTNSKIFKFLLIILIGGLIGPVSAQNILQQGHVSGNFQLDVQSYQPDTVLGITKESIGGKKAAMNAFGNINYTNGNFSAGIRYEAFLPPLEGYRPDQQGNGIAHRYLRYADEKYDITVGHFYGQFGNGLIFRAYEEWNLGFDNALDGVKVGLRPVQGVQITGVYGSQRRFWDKYNSETSGLVRGLDAEFSINELVKPLADAKTRINIGGSFVSKFQEDDSSIPYVLPENVGAFAGRFNLTRGGFNLQSEYAYRMADPAANKNQSYIYRPGQALVATATYSVKGLGAYVTAKRVDNMNFKTDRNAVFSDYDISYLPTISKEHSYSLAALYPYATYKYGEMGIAASVFYKLPKKSLLGGKYGSLITLNYSRINGIDKTMTEGAEYLNESGTYGYESEFFKVGDHKFYEDYTLEINRKFSRKFKMNAQITKLDYNKTLIEDEVEDGEEFYKAWIFIADMTYKITPTNALRTELQTLLTKEDRGNWAMALVEYSVAPKWSFSLIDQINLNQIENKTIHYYMASMAYVQNTTRLEVKYGRTKDGLLCVGGVCRPVPASSGLTLTITSSF